MSIEVVDAAPDQLLTTVDTIKLNLGITGSSQDEILLDLIRQSSDWIKNYTGRVFGRETINESLVGSGLPNLLLTRTPIVSVESVAHDGTEVTDFSIFDPEIGIIQRKVGFINTHFGWDTIDRHESPYGEKKWVVQYTAGYVLPNWDLTDDPRNLPYDLERACLEMVKMQFKQLKIDGSIRSYKVGDTTVQWDRIAFKESGGIGIPSVAVGILDFYRRSF